MRRPSNASLAARLRYANNVPSHLLFAHCYIGRQGSLVVLQPFVQLPGVLLMLLLQGAATVRKLLPGVVNVFIVAESEAQLVARLVSRKTEPMDKMLTRVQTAR